MNKTEQIMDKNPDEQAINAFEKTVLVVEDDRTHRVLMEKILNEFEFRTVPAENGLVALSKIDSGQHFDLVIMDWDMPELDGLETVKAIRAREIKEGRPRMAVIAFTSNREPGDREKCISAGMDAYLPKDVWMPKWRDTLVSKLQTLIAGNFDPADLSQNAGVKFSSKIKFDLNTFDLQALEQTASLLKDELEVAIDEYLEDAACYIRDIKSGLEEGDAEKAARGSHPLKSNSKGFGLSAVSQIAEAINAVTRKGSLTDVELMLPQLQDAFHRAEKKLRNFVRRAGY